MVVGIGICFQTGSEMGIKFEIYGNENKINPLRMEGNGSISYVSARRYSRPTKRHRWFTMNAY